MKDKRIVILGAGISGLGAGYTLRKKGYNPIILEKDADYGGLCGSFEIDGFRFDRFVHLSFAKDTSVNAIFKASSPEIITHIPNPYNIYKGKWVKHPVQNNLFVLDDDEKELIINDFLKRPTEIPKIENYEEWLRFQFGNYFAEHFPMVYTRKYWMKEACELRTEWVGSRIYKPSIDEVIKGSQTEDTPVTYYAKEMRYPAKGGFKAYLKELAKDADIRLNQEVQSINYREKTIKTKDGKLYHYDELISSLPLPEIILMMDDVPLDIKKSASELENTSGYHISIALKTKNIPPYLWWYIYDEDIIAARVYSPSIKSPDNVPNGCSSLEMEVYCKEGEYSEKQLLERTVGKLVDKGIINEKDILFTHIGFEKYANVIFSKSVYYNRKKVQGYIKSKGIKLIGRFGEWDYLWTDQSLLTGLNVKI